MPQPPGGFTDILARLVSQRLSPKLGQQVVENRSGGGSVVGTSAVAKSAPDGYTLLLVGPDHAINATLMPKAPYDAVKDFSPVIVAAYSPILLVAHHTFPPNSVKEFIEYAKANPGKINFASTGIGTGAHLAMELLRQQAGIDIAHVAYRGNGPAVVDLLGGQVAAMFLQAGVARPHIAAGKLKVLATASAKRISVMPDVPTLAESGLPGFEVQPWFGIVVPAGTPLGIVKLLNAEIGSALSHPEARKKLAESGAEFVPNSPADFASFLHAEIGRFGKIVKASGANVE